MKRVRVRAHLRMGRPVRAHWMALSEESLERAKETVRRWGDEDVKMAITAKKYGIFGPDISIERHLRYDEEPTQEQMAEITDEYQKATDEAKRRRGFAGPQAMISRRE